MYRPYTFHASSSSSPAASDLITAAAAAVGPSWMTDCKSSQLPSYCNPCGSWMTHHTSPTVGGSVESFPTSGYAGYQPSWIGSKSFSAAYDDDRLTHPLYHKSNLDLVTSGAAGAGAGGAAHLFRFPFSPFGGRDASPDGRPSRTCSRSPSGGAGSSFDRLGGGGIDGGIYGNNNRGMTETKLSLQLAGDLSMSDFGCNSNGLHQYHRGHQHFQPAGMPGLGGNSGVGGNGGCSQTPQYHLPPPYPSPYMSHRSAGDYQSAAAAAALFHHQQQQNSAAANMFKVAAAASACRIRTKSHSSSGTDDDASIEMSFVYIFHVSLHYMQSINQRMLSLDSDRRATCLGSPRKKCPDVGSH